MLTNGEENSLCSRRDELVSYLYGEMAEDRRTRLEEHLLDCTACTDEFAGLSEARFSVFEWHKEEFVPLATPEFTIPYEKKAVRAAAERPAAGLRSWITFGWPAFAMASIALVAAGSIALWIFATNTGTAEQLAKNTNVELVSPPAAPVQAVPVGEEPKPDVAVAVTPVAPARPHEIVPVRASTAPRHLRPVQPKLDLPNIKVDEAVVSPGKQPLRAPSLSAQVDDEDKSLRLTDLFDTLDSRM